MLLQIQQAKAKASQELDMRNITRKAYDNMSYEDNETTQDPDFNSNKASTDNHKPSLILENGQEVKIDRF